MSRSPVLDGAARTGSAFAPGTFTIRRRELPDLPRRAFPLGALLVLAAGIVLMAATAFLHLIDEPVVPFALLSSPVLAGGVAAAMALRDRHLAREARPLWSAGLFFTGLLAVLVALVLIYYVLPF